MRCKTAPLNSVFHFSTPFLSFDGFLAGAMLVLRMVNFFLKMKLVNQLLQENGGQLDFQGVLLTYIFRGASKYMEDHPRYRKWLGSPFIYKP